MPETELQYISAYQYYQFNTDNIEESRGHLLTTLKKVLEERIPEDLDVSIKKIEYKIEDRFLITLSGKDKDDLNFVSNIFKELTGEMIFNKKVKKNMELYGSFREVGKVGFGLFVDVGIHEPSKEVLIPLHTLREQLVSGRALPINDIIKLYGFMDFLPVKIEILKMPNTKEGLKKFEGRLADEFLEQLNEYIQAGLDIIFTTGAPRQSIKRTIAKRGHNQDIVEIQRLGPIETAIICKAGTTGPGIVSHIGKYLPKCRFSILKPAKLLKYWQ